MSIIVLLLIDDMRAESKILEMTPDIAWLLCSMQLINVNIPLSAANTTPPSTAKLFKKVQLEHSTLLLFSTYMTPPLIAVLFSNTVFCIIVVVSSFPANMTEPCS